MKRLTMLIPLALSAALLAACGQSGDMDAAANAINAGVSAMTTDAAQSAAAPPPETAPEDVKVIYGEISEVIGNSITIKEIERPQAPEGGEFRTFDASNLPEGFDPSNMPEGGIRTFDGATRGDAPVTRGDGTGRTSGGNMTRNEDGTITITSPDGTTQTIDPANPPEGMSVNNPGGNRGRNYTGEEIEVIIPTGIAIMTRTRGENGVEEKELPLSKLASGDVITVTYQADGKHIDSVYVSQAGAAGGGAFFGGGAFPDGAGGDFGFQISNDGGATFYQAAPAQPIAP